MHFNGACSLIVFKIIDCSPFRPILHKYANEDVSLGSWFIGLDVEHIDERRLCCGTSGKLLVFIFKPYPFLHTLSVH